MNKLQKTLGFCSSFSIRHSALDSMSLLGPNNALAWAHFRLNDGGWARTVRFAAVVMVVLAAGAITMYQFSGLDAARSMAVFTRLMLMIQGLLLVLFIPVKISAAIRSDLQSKMMESHRLMPLPATHAIAGYIAGGATQPLVLAAVVFAVGSFSAAAAGVSPQRWVFYNAVLLGLGPFAWVVSAVRAFAGKVAGPVIALFIMAPFISQGMSLVMLPGLIVLLSPMIGHSIFEMRTGAAVLPAPYAISFAAQVFFGVLCFVAAARKYRSGETIGVDTVLGLLFLLGWCAISFAGIREWEDFQPRGWRAARGIEAPHRVAGSLIAGLLLAFVPLAANAMERARRRRRDVPLDDGYPRRRPMPFPYLILIALTLLMTITFAAPDVPRPPALLLLRTAAVIATALIGMFFFVDWAYARFAKSTGVELAWLGLAWALPIAIDWVRYSLAERGTIERFDVFATCSPAGALIVLWTGSRVNTTAGIGVQILLALMPMCLWLIANRPRRNGSRV